MYLAESLLFSLLGHEKKAPRIRDDSRVVFFPNTKCKHNFLARLALDGVVVSVVESRVGRKITGDETIFPWLYPTRLTPLTGTTLAKTGKLLSSE